MGFARSSSRYATSVSSVERLRTLPWPKLSGGKPYTTDELRESNTFGVGLSGSALIVPLLYRIDLCPQCDELRVLAALWSGSAGARVALGTS